MALIKPVDSDELKSHKIPRDVVHSPSVQPPPCTQSLRVDVSVPKIVLPPDAPETGKIPALRHTGVVPLAQPIDEALPDTHVEEESEDTVITNPSLLYTEHGRDQKEKPRDTTPQRRKATSKTTSKTTGKKIRNAEQQSTKSVSTKTNKPATTASLAATKHRTTMRMTKFLGPLMLNFPHLPTQLLKQYGRISGPFPGVGLCTNIVSKLEPKHKDRVASTTWEMLTSRITKCEWVSAEAQEILQQHKEVQHKALAQLEEDAGKHRGRGNTPPTSAPLSVGCIGFTLNDPSPRRHSKANQVRPTRVGTFSHWEFPAQIPLGQAFSSMMAKGKLAKVIPESLLSDIRYCILNENNEAVMIRGVYAMMEAGAFLLPGQKYTFAYIWNQYRDTSMRERFDPIQAPNMADYLIGTHDVSLMEIYHLVCPEGLQDDGAWSALDEENIDFLEDLRATLIKADPARLDDAVKRQKFFYQAITDLRKATQDVIDGPVQYNADQIKNANNMVVARCVECMYCCELSR
jgi:hypothetical protein